MTVFLFSARMRAKSIENTHTYLSTVHLKPRIPHTAQIGQLKSGIRRSAIPLLVLGLSACAATISRRQQPRCQLQCLSEAAGRC